MAEFHHPFNFIPAKGSSPDAKTPYAQVAAGATQARHDLWQRENHSGRILCRLTLESPTVVGGEQTLLPDGAHCIDPYLRDGQPAIPGNSLRGLVGGIAETLSRSALRILDDTTYSVRKRVGGGLSAVGLLIKPQEGSTEAPLQLLPLTLPVSRSQGALFRIECKWRKAFEGRKLHESLPAYINGYRVRGTGTNASLAVRGGSFLDSHSPRSAYHSGSNPEWFYAKVRDLEWSEGAVPQPQDGLNVKEAGRSNFLIGQRLNSGVITRQEFDALPETEQALYTRGLLRILGIEGREDQIPTTKKHELFVPYPRIPRRQLLDVPSAVIESYTAIARQREEASRNEPEHRRLPFALAGYASWRLEHGMLVFFDIEERPDGTLAVSEVSLTSIWRKAIRRTVHDLFAEIDPDLLPWGENRAALTPAEALLGLVEETEARTARNLASRVRFSDALPLTGRGVVGSEITLKILSSPKPPCPALYFHKRTDRPDQRSFIAKDELDKQPSRPNGRKFYLHHPKSQIDAGVWRTANAQEFAKQKVRCTPLAAGGEFWFHLDYENLSAAELSLLVRSLRPGATFRHRLGMGKPLGLGRVRIDIAGIFGIDRLARYGMNALSEGRFQKVMHAAESAPIGPLPGPVAGAYPEESKTLIQQPEKFQFEDGLCHEEELRLLLAVGDPARLRAEVCYPYVTGQDREHEGFQWFMRNERESHRALQPVRVDGPLPTMET